MASADKKSRPSPQKAPPVIAIDVLVEAGAWVDEAVLTALAASAFNAISSELELSGPASEVSLVFTDDASIQKINAQWRAKDKPTNVLSFPAFPAEKSKRTLPPMLGDIILAFETITREAQLEQKDFSHHLSHLMVHGALHLLGFDHETEEEAEEMEALERRILERLAIGDPYA